MRIPRALAGVVVAGLVAAGAARAGAGEKPRIERSDAFDNCYQGSMMSVTGSGFGTDPRAVSVILGSDTIPAISVTGSEVVFQVPPKASVGRRQITVAVGGAKSNALDVEVQDRAKRPTRQDSGPVATNTTIRLDPPSLAADRGMFIIVVAGKADYPNDSVIYLSLRPSSVDDKRTLMTTDARVKDGFIHATFDLKGRALFPGLYWVEAEFSLDKQPSPVREAFRQAFPRPEDAAAHEHGRDKKSLRVGDPESGAQEIHEHFAATLRKARALTDDLEDGFASAGRSMFRGKDGKVDELAWEAWLQEWPYQTMDASAFRARTAQVRKTLRFLAGNGTFDADGWRGWMDGAWREGLVTLAHDHAAFTARYQFSPCDEAATKLAALLSDLMRHSQARSHAIYEGSHLETTAADTEQPKDPALRVAGTTRVSRPIIEHGVKDIAKMVGLDEKLEVIPPLK